MDDCSTVHTGLPAGYYDKDMQMEYSIANLLLKYFDEELCGDTYCPYDQEEAVRQWSRLVEIYNMFKQRKNAHGDFFLDEKFIDNEELTAALVEVVRCRGMLWS